MAAPDSNRFAAAHSRRMRGQKSARTSTREKIVLFVSCVLVAQLPWIFGGIHIVAQEINMALVLAGFFALFMPLKDPDSPTPSKNLHALVRFPVFWLTLGFLGYVIIQFLNPYACYKVGLFNGVHMVWQAPLEHIKWLPSGLDVPYYDMSGARYALYWAAPLLMMSVLKIGLTRRRSWMILIWTSILTACLMCVLAIAVRLSGSDKMLWLYQSGQWAVFLFGSFVNNTHGATYCYLNLALALGVFLHWREQDIEKNRLSGRHWLCIFPVIVLLAGIGYAGSRASFIIAAVLCAMLFVFAAMAAIRRRRMGALKIMFVSLTAGVLVCAAGGYASIEYQLSALKRFELLDSQSSVAGRLTFIKVAADVVKERPLWGHGGGSFFYSSDKYTRGNPAFVTTVEHGKTAPFQLEHAHCDWLEFPADVGIAGSLFLLAILVYWLANILPHLRTASPLVWYLLLGLLLLGMQGTIDFPAACPAVVFTAILMCVGAAVVGKRQARALH